MLSRYPSAQYYVPAVKECDGLSRRYRSFTKEKLIFSGGIDENNMKRPNIRPFRIILLFSLDFFAKYCIIVKKRRGINHESFSKRSDFFRS